MKYKKQNIYRFLNKRGWEKSQEGDRFTIFLPPASLNLPEDYRLEIPSNEKLSGFQNYIDGILSVLSDIYENEFVQDDLEILFSKDNSILKFRIFDKETNNGTINFPKYIGSLEAFKKILSQAVTFTITNKPIFGEAKDFVASYLDRCRSLQTEKGSFVTKFQVPNDEIYSTVNKITTSNVNDKLFDVLEFVRHEVLRPDNDYRITEEYVSDHQDYINYELLNSIKNLYQKSQINNAEFLLNSGYSSRTVTTEKVQSRLKYFRSYIRNIKEVLLETEPLETIGFIKSLSSSSPQHSENNEVVIHAEVANTEEKIKITLNSNRYLEAIRAHRNEWAIRVKGKARQYKTMYSIEDLDEFEVIER